MTYSGQETSQESGRPVDLYTFELGLQVYRLTSAEDDQSAGGLDYLATEGLSRGKITQAREARQSALEISLPAEHDLPSRYVTSVPSEQARFTLQQLHRGDGSVATLFRGLLKSVAFSEDGTKAKLAIEPPVSIAARQIPRFDFRGQCNNVLGDGADGGPGLCDVDLEDPAFRLAATATAQSGLQLTVPGAAAFGDGWFDAGTVETTDGLDARMILRHVGDVLTLHFGFPFPVVGEQVILRAGCAHDIQTCSTKFDKVLRYQGFAFIPTINIFETGLDPERC